MTRRDTLSPGDEWNNHYRGFSLQITPDGDIWWQLYKGTDRLTLKPAPEKIIEELLKLKRIGGRVHITEQGDVLTKVEAGDDYDQLYVGTIDDLDGDLLPQGSPEYGIDLRPKGLSPGDLWPSVYDGSRYSFINDRYWWHSSHSHKRHPIPDGLTDTIESRLRQYKPEGGSFRVLPWGDVITLISTHPTQKKVSKQFNELPRVIQNIIKLRKDRDVEMLPIYVGSLDGYEINVSEPTSLTDSLSKEEQESLASWAENLGRTSSRTITTHKSDPNSTNGENHDSLANTTTSQSSGTGTNDSSGSTKPSTCNNKPADQGNHEKKDGNKDVPDSGNDNPPKIDDDPLEWIKEDMESIGKSKIDQGPS